MIHRHNLRPAAPSDGRFLQHLFASSRRELFAGTGLPPAQMADLLTMQWRAQQKGHAARHAEAIDTIVAVGDERIGRQLVAWGVDEVHLVDIALLPEWTGRGIGSALVGDLIAQASATNRIVVLEVAADNHRAIALYRRLGFEGCNDDAASHLVLRHA